MNGNIVKALSTPGAKPVPPFTFCQETPLNPKLSIVILVVWLLTNAWNTPVLVGVTVFVGVGLVLGVFVGVFVGVRVGVIVGVGVIVEVGVGLAQVTNDSITPLEKLTKEKFGVVNKIL